MLISGRTLPETVKERRLLEEINRLDENLQEIVSLRIYEIGMLTGKPKRCHGGVHRAKVKLQQEMEGYDEG
ncbi:hypothetical protein PO124_16825 [Bacillus licheniformis]|nr:hypothetical protein [Bacillus licheniformis]